MRIDLYIDGRREKAIEFVIARSALQRFKVDRG
jgi:hypothetical protein